MHLPAFDMCGPILALALFNIFLSGSLLKMIWNDNKVAKPQVWEYREKSKKCVNANTPLCYSFLQAKINNRIAK